MYVCMHVCLFFLRGFLYVAMMQASNSEMCLLPLPPECWSQVVYHYSYPYLVFIFTKFFIVSATVALYLLILKFTKQNSIDFLQMAETKYIGVE